MKKLKQALAAVLVVVITLSAVARGQTQAPATAMHVRLTGVPDRYEVPGVVSIEQRRVVGRTAETNDRFARYVDAPGTRAVSIIWPGTRVEGTAMAIDRAVLTFIADGEAMSSFVPLDAISKIERFQPRHSRAAAVAAGVAVGVAGFFGGFIGAISRCGDENGPCVSKAVSVVIVAAVGGGAVVAWLLRGASWRAISAENLEAQLRTQPR
jgi:hypothetical protein